MNTATTQTPASETTTPKKFVSVSITREEYRAVRELLTDDSKAALRALPNKELYAKRQEFQGMYRALDASTQMIDNVKTVVIPTASFQYVPAGEQKGKRWAYRTALEETIKFIDGVMKERNNVVSPLLTPKVVQDGAAPVEAEPVAAGATSAPTDDLPL